MLRTASVTAAAFAAAVAVAACGGSSGPNNSNNSGNSASIRRGSAAFRADMLRVSQCIRAHGVPNYPDPPSRGEMQSESSGNGSVTVNGVKLDASAQTLQNAQRACAKYAAVGPLVSSSQLASIKQGSVRTAVCMRANGVPDFPDPSITTGPGGHGLRISRGSGAVANLNPYSPAFKAAHAKCNKLVLNVANLVRRTMGMGPVSLGKSGR
jgi:hypothetical protein